MRDRGWYLKGREFSVELHGSTRIWGLGIDFSWTSTRGRMRRRYTFNVIFLCFQLSIESY